MKLLGNYRKWWKRLVRNKPWSAIILLICCVTLHLYQTVDAAYKGKVDFSPQQEAFSILNTKVTAAEEDIQTLIPCIKQLFGLYTQAASLIVNSLVSRVSKHLVTMSKLPWRYEHARWSYLV